MVIFNFLNTTFLPRTSQPTAPWTPAPRPDLVISNPGTRQTVLRWPQTHPVPRPALAMRCVHPLRCTRVRPWCLKLQNRVRHDGSGFLGKNWQIVKICIHLIWKGGLWSLMELLLCFTINKSSQRWFLPEFKFAVSVNHYNLNVSGVYSDIVYQQI